MKKIFITGLNGLLATNLSNDLLENGFLVKGLIRNKLKFKGHNHKNLALIQGDLFDDLTPHLNGIDIVIHAAAETNQNLINYADYCKTNCNTTIQLLNTAIECHVKKFIYISTSSTLGYGSINNLGTEQQKIRFPFNNSLYTKSKLEAENYLLQNTDKIEVIIINPSFMLGAYDSKPSSGKIILMAWKKKIVFYPSGGKNFVHVKDACAGIINSLEKGKNGEKYLIANENLTYAEFFKKLNHLTNQNPIMIKIPKQLLITLGYFGDFLRLLHIKTSISSINMKILCVKNFYSNDKSITALNIKYQPVDFAIKDAIDYFQK